MHSETDFRSVENDMIHSRSILLLHSSAEMSRAEQSQQSKVSRAKLSRAEQSQQSGVEPAELGRIVQGTDGRDSTVRLMDQWMEFSLVEREC